jgi:hypothetical protein
MNFQVQVQLTPTTIDYAKFLPDGSDIRFLDSNDNQCDYWIELWNATGKSVIWVEMPEMGSFSVDLYYGNAGAPSLSNGTATFLLFDDFNDNSIDSSIWTLYTPDPNSNITETQNKLCVNATSASGDVSWWLAINNSPRIFTSLASDGNYTITTTLTGYDNWPGRTQAGIFTANDPWDHGTDVHQFERGDRSISTDQISTRNIGASPVLDDRVITDSNLTLNPAYLKWTKYQDNWTTYYSGDWENYTKMISYINHQDNVYFGFYGATWLYGNYFEGYFDNFIVRAYHNTDIIGTATDSVGPQFFGVPASLVFELGAILNYSLSAVDPSGLDSWWLNDSSPFTINNNGKLTNNTFLPVGEYPLLVNINDTLGNIGINSLTIYVYDTTPPTWITTPENQSITLGTPFVYQLNATDLSPLSTWWINDTHNFHINTQGLLTNATILQNQTYYITIYVNDTSGSTLNAKIFVNVTYLQQLPITLPIETILYYTVGGITIIVVVIALTNISKKRIDI